MNEFLRAVVHIVSDVGFSKVLLPFLLLVAAVFAGAAYFRQYGDRALFFGNTSITPKRVALITIVGVAVAIGAMALALALMVAEIELPVSDAILLGTLFVIGAFLRVVWYPAALKNIFDHLRRIGRLR